MIKMRKLLFWLLVLPLALVLLVQLYFFVQIWWWVGHNPDSTSFMRQQRAVLQGKNPKFQLKQKWVPYDHISNNIKRAIIASEDANFSGHDGVDWAAVHKAFDKNAKKGKVVAGGSTITQQLAKNLFLSGERSYVRKAQEFVITYMIEFLMDKERIFEIYLNVVEWGNGVFGVEAAARYYFGVPAAALTAQQGARLAVMLPNPRFFDRHRESPYLAQRTNLILRRMNSAALP